MAAVARVVLVARSAPDPDPSESAAAVVVAAQLRVAVAAALRRVRPVAVAVAPDGPHVPLAVRQAGLLAVAAAAVVSAVAQRGALRVAPHPP